MSEPHISTVSNTMPALEFYVLLAMFYHGRMDWTLPTCVTRRRHSSCCTAIKVIVMYWCFLFLWYWYWLFVHDSWAVSSLLNVNKIITSIVSGCLKYHYTFHPIMQCTPEHWVQYKNLDKSSVSNECIMKYHNNCMKLWELMCHK